MKLFKWVLICLFIMSVPLSGCPTCLALKETMHGKSQLYTALSGMKVTKQKQLVRLIHRLNHTRGGSAERF